MMQPLKNLFKKKSAYSFGSITLPDGTQFKNVRRNNKTGALETPVTMHSNADLCTWKKLNTDFNNYFITE